LSASYSPDGERVVTASWDNTAIIWDARTGQKLLSLQGHTDWVLSASYSPDGERVVSASPDTTAIIWDARTGQKLLSLQGHTDWVLSASYSPDGERVVTASRGGSAWIWDASTGKQLAQLWTLHGGNWLTVTPEGYFDGSARAVALVRHADGAGGLIDPVESRKYHRPDLVRKALE
jgi:WD40 repeat protein